MIAKFLIGIAVLTFLTAGIVSRPRDVSLDFPSSTPTVTPTPTSSVSPDVVANPRRFELELLPREPTAQEYLDAGLGSPDVDCDGVKNSQDNCLLVYNPRQQDNDKDSVGDASDRHPNKAYRPKRDSDPDTETSRMVVLKCDADQDGVYDDRDNCPITPNPNQRDSNKDGVGDACEEGNSR